MGGGHDTLRSYATRLQCAVPECPIESGQNRESEAWRRLPGTREGQRTLGLQGNRLQGNRLKGDKQDCIPAKALTR